MRAIDILRRSGRNLSQAKGRTILTSLAIGVGAFTIALAMAAGNGGHDHYVILRLIHPSSCSNLIFGTLKINVVGP